MDLDKMKVRTRKNARGFTLVELLLVLVILALIGGLVLPNIIGKAEGAKVKAAGSQISRLAGEPQVRGVTSRMFSSSPL